MALFSILFQSPDRAIGGEPPGAPTFFRDLKLNQVVNALTLGWKEYDLAPFYYSPLSDLDSITYRQEVMQDLEIESLVEAVQSFSGRMRDMRKCLSKVKELHYKYALERWFLIAVETYVDAVKHLSLALRSNDVRSHGLCGFREYLDGYTRREAFQELATETEVLRSNLSSIHYSVLLRDGGVTVGRYDGEMDYSAVVEETFEKFRDTATTTGHRLSPYNSPGMNHVQAQVLDRLALLYPEPFGALDNFYSSHQDYLDPTVARFDREIHFYIAYLAYIEKMRHAGLTFCLPQLSQIAKEVKCRDGFDLALAHKLIAQRATVVTNDFYLSAPERILVVSGPNQGGKTTFARMFGQMQYLASLGCPVPGTDVHLFLFDQMFTHFEREENITNLRGKLQDDLVRIRDILESATPRSVIVMNEMFSSTTVKDALYLSKKVMTSISDLDTLCVWVTFLDELASFNEKTVSMVSTVNPDNPAVRTYKLQRKPADGLAYALAIAHKYRVTYGYLKERIKA